MFARSVVLVAISEAYIRVAGGLAPSSPLLPRLLAKCCINQTFVCPCTTSVLLPLTFPLLPWPLLYLFFVPSVLLSQPFYVYTFYLEQIPSFYMFQSFYYTSLPIPPSSLPSDLPSCSSAAIIVLVMVQVILISASSLPSFALLRVGLSPPQSEFCSAHSYHSYRPGSNRRQWYCFLFLLCMRCIGLLAMWPVIWAVPILKCSADCLCRILAEVPSLVVVVSTSISIL